MTLSLRATSTVATIALSVAGLSAPVFAESALAAATRGHDLTKAEAQAIGHPLLTQALGRHPGGAASSFRDLRTTIDTRHTAHVAVQQTFHGVPVWGGQAIAHIDSAGDPTSVTDAFVSSVKTPTTPSITADSAVAGAKADAKAPAAQVVAKPDLWVLPGKGGDALVWRVRLNHTDGTNHPSAPVVFVSATTGKVVSSYDDLQTDAGTGHSDYSGDVTIQTTPAGGVWQLKDGTRGNAQVNSLNHGTSGSGTLMTDADNVWGSGTTDSTVAGQQSAGVDAAYAAALTFDYYKTVFGRNGIANNGIGAQSRVHYGNSYVNAYWDDSCFCMTYGDGSGNVAPLTSIDVGGHEMTHGVTANSVPGGLTYTGESGGLNEATSDIFGTAVEFFANNAADPGDYLIGEKININGDGTPLRYMDQPSKDGGSKDCWYSGIANLDVHYSSGVANHYFYLLSEGSGAKVVNGVSYNSPTCNGSTVPGITRDKAARIWYRALTTYFTSNTNYAQARTATLSSAADLYGVNSPEYLTTCNTWAAVSVGATCSGGGSTTTVLQNNVPVSNLSGATGSSQAFTLAVPAGATNLSFTMSGGTGDADMYVKLGSAPTLSSYDCRPYVNGNSETCTFAAPSAGTYYVMLQGYSAYSGVTLLGKYSTSSGSTALSNNVPVTGLSAATGASLSYTMAVPAGASNLSFTISGGTGDADLYVKFGSAPSTTSYDCRPYLSGNSETCTFAAPSTGTYYVMLRGYTAFSGVTLLGKYSTGSPSTVLGNNVPVTGLSASTGGSLSYTMAVPAGATNLSFTISGGTGDADLYVKFGSAPTTTSYSCRPYLTGNSETCTFAAPSTGTYYVMVRAYASFSGVTLVGKYS